MKSLRFWFTIISALLLGRLCYFSEPYGVSVDESTYLSMAEILRSGGVLYRDVVDRKPPALIWLYELIGSVFAPWNIHAVHFVFFVFVVALVVLGGMILRRLGHSAAVAERGMIFFAFFSSCFPREVLSANAEIPMLLVLALAILAFIHGTQERNNFWVFIAAALAAFSTLFKQYSVLIFAPIYLGWMIYEFRTTGFWRKHLIAIAGSLAALLLVSGAVTFYFYVHGSLKEFVYYFALDGLKYVASSRLVQNHATSAWGAIGGMLGSWILLWWGAARLARHSLTWENCVLILGAIGSLLTIFLSGRYYTHYFIPLIWFLSLLAAVGLSEIWNERKKWIVGLMLLTFVFYAGFNFEREWVSNKWSFTREKQGLMRELGIFIRGTTAPSDRIVVWGMASQIYLLSERGSGTRFVFSDFISGRQPGYRSDVSIPMTGAMEDFLHDLESKRPKLIVDTSSAELNDYQWFPPKRFPEFQSFLERNYLPAGEFDLFTLWKRRDF